MYIPPKMRIANVPTPVYALDKINPDRAWSRLYIKRDDLTGFELSGNKVRKFEYSIKEALDRGARMLITCGVLQSNHAKAAASVAAQYGLGCHLVLSGCPEPPDGNYLFDKLFGSEIMLVPPEQYEDNYNQIMADLKTMYDKRGVPAYILAAGGSNGIGMFGYMDAYREICQQEKMMGIRFDTIAVTDGSGSTYAGLYAANKLCCGHKHIVGINANGNKAPGRIEGILREGACIMRLPCAIPTEDIYLNFDYYELGHPTASPELVAFIKFAARETGFIVDPVFTAKGLLGVLQEIRKHNPLLRGNVLFIHTGWQIGLFPQKELFY